MLESQGLKSIYTWHVRDLELYLVQHRIIGISRFLKEIPEEFLSEESSLSSGENNLEATFSNDRNYTWSYSGTSSKKSGFDFGLGKTSNVNGFAFKTPESFLNGINKKQSENVDVSMYKSGARVYHKKFGEGTINYIEEEGEDYKVDINFDKVRTQKTYG